MAEENDGIAPVGEAVKTDAEVKTEVKQRAPRRQKTAAEVTSAASETVTEASPVAIPATADRKSRRGRSKSSDAKAIVGKGGLKGAALKQRVGRTAKSSAPAIDELEDLIQLEEENKRLRKTLAEKLRQENSDLRKRLGFA